MNTTKTPIIKPQSTTKTLLESPKTQPIYQDLKDPEITQNSPEKKKTVNTVIYWASIIFALYILWSIFKKHFHSFLIKKIEHFSQEESLRSYSFFLGIQFVFSWVLIPGLTYFDIIMASLMKNFYKSFNIIFWGTFIGGLISFFVVKYFLRNLILKKFGDNLFYLIFKEEVKKNPWSISFLANVLMIPSCFRNLMLPLTEMTFWQFALPKIPLYVLFTAVICLLGDEITDFEEFVKSEKPKEKTSVQKFNFCLTATFLILTIWLMVWAGWIFNKKINEFRERRNEELVAEEEEERLVNGKLGKGDIV